MNKVYPNRIPWIDICRGIGILLVLYGHALGSDKNRFLIYAFHMPLFFFLSGIVFRHSHASFLSIVLKNTRTILFPYLVFALLTYILGLLLIPPATLSHEAITKQLYGILYGNANEGYLAFNTALWFLPCLFVTKLLFTILDRIIKSKKMLWTVLIVFSVGAYLGSVFYRDIKLPFGIEIALTGVVFFGAGYLWNQSEKIKYILQQKKIVFSIGALILLLIFATLNFSMHGSQIDMRVNRLNDFYLFYLAAFSGIASAVLGSMIIKKSTLLEYIGKHSMLLFGWHTLIFTYFKHISFFPPVSYEFLTPTLHLTFATMIILLTRLLFLKTKSVLVLQKNGADIK